MKGQVTLLQDSVKDAKAANLKLKEEVSSLTSKLDWANFKRDKLEHEVSRFQRDAKRSSSREVDLTTKVKFLKGKVKSLSNEMERAGDEARGKGV